VSGENRLALVKAAIRRQGPARVPILFFNRDKEQSDIVIVDVVRHFTGPGEDRSEWGFTWERLDRTMGQPTAPLLHSWADLDALVVPDPDDPQRFASVAEARRDYGERYYLASLVLTGFTVMSFLRGFAELLVDLVEQPEEVERLADRVFGFEEAVLRRLPAHGFHGAAFFDDWGTQDSLILSPELWQERFKPRYRRQFALAHELGLDVYFHTCGRVREIVPDLIEVGVDMLNLSQPNLFDIEELGRSFGAQVCFVCPVSYQTTSITGSVEDIYRDVRRLVDSLGRPDGGLIGYVEEYSSIGMSETNYRACIRAFRGLGRYR
jgi:uroporphyrinogen decarboxylase